MQGLQRLVRDLMKVGRGNRASHGKLPSLLWVGDSLVELAAPKFGIYCTFVGGNLTGVMSALGSRTWPAGAATLSYNPVGKFLAFSAPGDALGTPVSVEKGGHFTLYSANTADSIRVGIIDRRLPTIAQTDTLTQVAHYAQNYPGSPLACLESMMYRRIVQDHSGVGGSLVADVTDRIRQTLIHPAQYIIDMSGTNDLSAATPVATVIATKVAQWRAWVAAGKTVICVLIPARYDPSLADNTNYTVQKLRRQQAINAGLISAAQTLDIDRVFIADAYTRTADPASGKVRAGKTNDGLHFGSGFGAIGYDIACAVFDVLDKLILSNNVFPQSSGGAYYDATDNPGGNLLASNQGTFNGTGGSITNGAATPAWAGTTAYAKDQCVINAGNLYRALNAATSGATAPTHTAGVVSDGAVFWLFLKSGVTSGLAAGWTISRTSGSAALVQCHKVAATDGGQDWQEFNVYGAAADAETFRLYPTTLVMTPIAANDNLDFSVEHEIIGAGCQYLKTDFFVSGGTAVIAENRCFENLSPGLRHSGILSSQYRVMSDNTAVQPRYFFSSLTGANFQLRVRNAVVRKI